MKELKVKLTFTEEVLGTASSNPEIHREFIASKAPNAESLEQEVESLGVNSVVENGSITSLEAMQEYGIIHLERKKR